MIGNFGIIALFGLSFVLALALCAVAARVSARLNLLDRPNERSSHSVATPRTGGVAIIATCLLLSGWTMDGATLVAICAIAILGFVDDVKSTPALLRLVVQGIVAVFFLVSADGAMSGISLLAFSLWLVAAVNVFNFMDGINGIAALQAAVWGITLYLHGVAGGLGANVAVITVAGAALGFFTLNARGVIFMGDAGSLSIGFLLAGTATKLSAGSPSIFVLALPFLPFVFDASITLVKRVLRRENILRAHRKHLYQLLTRMGWSHLEVTSLWTALALGGAIISMGYASLGKFLGALAVSLFLAGHFFLALYVSRRWAQSAQSEYEG